MSRAPAAVRRAGRVPVPLALAALVVAALVSLPLGYLVVRAVGADAGAWDVVLRGRTLSLVGHTILLVATVTAAAAAIGVPLAWLVTRSDLPWRRGWAVALALPLVIPSYVVALVLISTLRMSGFAGSFLALTLATYPYVYLLAVASLRRLDPAQEEASQSLGAGPAETFRRVTLPALRPSIAVGALLAALYALSDFGVVSLMRYEALTRAVFQQYRGMFDRTPAALLALVLVALTAVALIFENRARGRAERASADRRGAARAAKPVPLGRWRRPALAVCTLVVGAALVLPVAVLGYWGARAFERGELAGGDIAGAAWHSLLAASLAALAAVAAAIPIAVLAGRHPRRWTALVERVAYASNALPGIVIALALVFFAARYAEPVYQTLGLLVFAYVVRFFPQAVAGAHAALLRVGPRVEESARSLGRRPPAVLATVTIPLMAPGLLAGATLVFLSTMKELPATLLLRPIGFDTLATEVWTATGVASYSSAAVPALLLVLLSAPVVYLLVARPAFTEDVPEDRSLTPPG